jgi:dihydropteroate synthase|tara:strand:+ start:3071 stop:4123 length:1053 start_codon:yes stop_codon:yes gene_type:complete
MKKYYTRACNFYYGIYSKEQIKKKLTLALCGNNEISFDKVEIFSRFKGKISSKVIELKNISSLPKLIKKKVLFDLKKITSKRKFLNQTHIMGILNMTPDSFSDGGKYNKKNKAFKRIKIMIDSGADIIDVGGESTRPGSKIISTINEWKRIKEIIKNFKKKNPKTLLSIDTRKSKIMSDSIKLNADVINDVSCFYFDKNSITSIKKKNIFKIIHHMQGTPQTMQIKPKYDNVLLDIYDFFESQIIRFKKIKSPNKIILDPGIGFGKNLKHNLILLNKISLFHSLGFPILIGTSRKRFIGQITKKFDTKERLGGTLSSIIFSLTQGIQIFRVHNVEEIKQGILVFKKLLNK